MNTPQSNLTKVFWPVLASLLFSLSAVWAQTTSGGGTLQGTVKDESGAAIQIGRAHV